MSASAAVELEVSNIARLVQAELQEGSETELYHSSPQDYSKEASNKRVVRTLSRLRAASASSVLRLRTACCLAWSVCSF